MRLVQSVCLSLLAVLVVAGDAMAAPALEGGDTISVYTFDDLFANCFPGMTTSGLYQDLAFSSSSFIVCPTPNGTNGLQPAAFTGGRFEVRVGLPGPASSVSVESYLYDYGDAPTLIAYDSMGVEIGRSEDPGMNAWKTLEVSATDTPIAEIGLLMPQFVSYLDNLTVVFGTVGQGDEPEPDVVPEDVPDEEPTGDEEPASDPVSIDQCTNAGWMAFGFRNQGQCVSFVRNGRDSR